MIKSAELEEMFLSSAIASPHIIFVLFIILSIYFELRSHAIVETLFLSSKTFYPINCKIQQLFVFGVKHNEYPLFGFALYLMQDYNWYQNQKYISNQKGKGSGLILTFLFTPPVLTTYIDTEGSFLFVLWD